MLRAGAHLWATLGKKTKEHHKATKGVKVKQVYRGPWRSQTAMKRWSARQLQLSIKPQVLCVGDAKQRRPTAIKGGKKMYGLKTTQTQHTHSPSPKALPQGCRPCCGAQGPHKAQGLTSTTHQFDRNTVIIFSTQRGCKPEEPIHDGSYANQWCCQGLLQPMAP